MTNEEIIIKAKEECKLRGLSHHTQDEYLGVLKRFLNYYDNHPLETMGEREIREYLLYLIDHKKSSDDIPHYFKNEGKYTIEKNVSYNFV